MPAFSLARARVRLSQEDFLYFAADVGSEKRPRAPVSAVRADFHQL